MKNRITAALAVAFAAIWLSSCTSDQVKAGINQTIQTVQDVWDSINTGINFALGQVPIICAQAGDLDTRFRNSQLSVKYPQSILTAEAKAMAALFGSPDAPCVTYPTTLSQAIAEFKPAYKRFRDAQASAQTFANSQ